jgi:hypothetical protein
MWKFLLLALATGVVCWAQSRWFVLQYGYFLRVPLLCGVGLVLLPWLAERRFPEVLANLLDVYPVDVFFVSALALICGQAVVQCAVLIAKGADARFGLPFSKTEYAERKLRPQAGPAAEQGSAAMALAGRPRSAFSRPAVRRRRQAAVSARFVVAMALAAPLASRICLRTGSNWLEDGWWLSWSLACAALVSVGTAYLSRPIRRWVHRLLAGIEWLWNRGLDKLSDSPPESRVPWARREIWRGYQARGQRAFGHEVALAHAAVTFSIYAIGYRMFEPGSGPIAQGMPALVYLLWIATMLCLVLSGMTFFLDLFRIPLLVGLAAMSFGLSRMFRVEHHYPTQPRVPFGELPYRAEDHARQWTRLHPAHAQTSMVVVAVSGGGITAARWAAEVLCGLTEVEPWGRRFASSIAAISSVSGGSIGALYYLDAWDAGEPPTAVALDLVKRQSDRSSLASVAWGMAYRDLWGFLLPPALWIEERAGKDRGWALETSWGRGFRSAKERLFADVRDLVCEQQRPAQIFNATVVETGQRLVIGPFDSPARETDTHSGEVYFQDLWSARDIRSLTAARLSATFPFVTPVACPQLPPEDASPALHVADGGYYDNSGLVGALGYLHAALPALRLSGHRRVVLLEIRAFPSTEHKPVPLDGWRSEATGPLDGMLNVRVGGQRSRNAIEKRLLIELFESHGVTVVECIFELGTELSLSWHLTKQEIDAIENEFRWALAAEKPRLEGLLELGAEWD